ncbi:hypothetical protein DF034_17495 [Burkholderia anthina]|uniref:hypothetical protein n=1 Tax=Burkholderia anthina TaxID=179879 RepID=UPI000F5D8517|nr:hypothetical protein [Burkholderia anthina]ELK6464649.1 hypothetical protein [Burkholderia contaminans]RQX81810.1 hypothetical protein DF034_17495 [Burkholderia anthina]
MKKRYGRADSGKGQTRSESRDVDTFFGKSPYKPEADDRPKRTPRDRGTGTSLERKLRGKVIG